MKARWRYCADVIDFVPAILVIANLSDRIFGVFHSLSLLPGKISHLITGVDLRPLVRVLFVDIYNPQVSKVLLNPRVLDLLAILSTRSS